MTSAATHDGATAAVAAGRRIVGVDIARCLALIGMMATHILPGVGDDGRVPLIQLVAGGRSAALFATLAGVSLALVSGRTQPWRGRALAAARASILARAAVIAVIGLVLGSLDSGVAVILVYYAVLFVLALPFLRLDWKPLAALAAGWAIVGPILSQLARIHLPDPSYASTSLDQLFADPADLALTVLVNGYYPALPWLAYMFAGLAVGRLALDRVRVAVALTAVGATLAIVAWGSSWLLLHRLGGFEVLERTLPRSAVGFNDGISTALLHGLYGTTPTTSWWWLTVAAPHSTTPFDLLHTIGTAMLVLGVALLVGRLAPRVLAVAFGAGTMTLSLYTLHVIALASNLGPDRGPELYALHVGAALVLGALWRGIAGQGPLERVAATAGQAAAAAVRSHASSVTQR